ncbi:hypothetical protein PLICRDRAFT_627966 [Plicaturopsis crispa FD-325 SS-3]|nr:hypothetical protein PLICRDRAFT_627966 [Plicaturopsis crispa FD-325 SS-3]
MHARAGTATRAGGRRPPCSTRAAAWSERGFAEERGLGALRGGYGRREGRRCEPGDEPPHPGDGSHEDDAEEKNGDELSDAESTRLPPRTTPCSSCRATPTPRKSSIPPSCSPTWPCPRTTPRADMRSNP